MADPDGESFEETVIKILHFLEQHDFYSTIEQLEIESGISIRENPESPSSNDLELTTTAQSHAKPWVEEPNFLTAPIKDLLAGLPLPPLVPNGDAPTPAHHLMPPGGWMPNLTSVPHQPFSAEPFHQNVLGGKPNTCSVPNQPVSAQPFDQNAPVPEPPVKRQKLVGTSEEVNKPLAVWPAPPSDDLPHTVVVIFKQGSEVKSLDFHPVQQTLLLAGTVNGDFSIWEVGRKDWLVSQNFTIWDLESCSSKFQNECFADNFTTSVNCVRWSPDGALFGVAHSKHIVHLYFYHGGDVLRQHLEIDAHFGNVYDIAFSHQTEEALYVITCGEDMTVKMWKAVYTGDKISPVRTFRGHEAPVYSVCSYQIDPKYIFSVDANGKIKAWVNCDLLYSHDAAPSWGRMVCTVDGRLFLCGTSKDGNSYLVEWDHNDGGNVKQIYNGLRKRSASIVQFDTANSRYLAAGDDYHVKFWDMDNKNMLTYTCAAGGLPSCPCVRFNKGGTLLAITTCEDGIKVLANDGGLQHLCSSGKRPLDGFILSLEKPIIDTASRSAKATSNEIVEEPVPKNNVPYALGHTVVGSRTTAELQISEVWKLSEINEKSQLFFLGLSTYQTSPSPGRIIRLTYANSGRYILALTRSALHELKLCQTRRKDHIVSEKATPTRPSQHFLPSPVLPSLVLSDNGYYLLITSQVENSLLKVADFSTTKRCFLPPMAATAIALLPQNNNIIAIGTNDSLIRIYNVQTDELKVELIGHTRSVIGLDFSALLNVLVSSGSDRKLCVWSVDGWRMLTSKILDVPPYQNSSPLIHTRIQFHQDQIHLLVVQETQLGIYKAPNLECLSQWNPSESLTSITDATYSSNSLSVYASFFDGSVRIFAASTLEPFCVIRPSAYLSPRTRKYPVSIAADPTDPYRFALGYTDGEVAILQPPESKNEVVTPAPHDDGGRPGVSSKGSPDEQTEG
ncbi:Topless family [Trema orientale]|uniref:Topless family n=1 Tax=Trema orientale TaxID=63057 RepID=A0A2P5EX32_TREOI|nr:Topless family [Trema orientale]